MSPRKSKLRLETDAELHEQGRRRAVVLEYLPNQGDVLFLRAKGLKTRHAVKIEDLYCYAAKRTAEVERKRKREEKEAKRRARFALC